MHKCKGIKQSKVTEREVEIEMNAKVCDLDLYPKSLARQTCIGAKACKDALR